MTSGVLVILSLGGGVSWDESATLVAFAKAFEMLGHGVPTERPLWEPWLDLNQAWLTHP
jgi:hypothetical protein